MAVCRKCSNFAGMKCKMNHRISFYGLLLTAGMLLAGCSKDSGDSAQQAGEEPQEIRVNANVWRMMDATRATTYDNQAAIQEAGFKCYAYLAGSTTAYINGSEVSYAASKWSFDDGKHYWPMSYNLDFFAHIPRVVPSYIQDVDGNPGQVTYYVHNPNFKCVMPMTNTGASGQNTVSEFVYALTTGQSKAAQGASGVNLTFQHPFTKIILKLSSTQADIEINKITLKTIKDHGTYVDDTGWSTTGDATNFVAEYSGTKSANADLGTFLMIPQAWAGEIEVNASWNDWGDTPVEHTVTTTIPAITWQPGYSYTYTFTITLEDLVVNLTDFTEQW